MTNTFTARATRNEGSWSIRIDEEPGIITQTRRLDQIPDMVRDALELFLELSQDPSTATINVIVNNELNTRITAARKATEAAQKAQEEAAQQLRSVATDLRNQGLSLRDVGHLLGVSFQRAQQLATS